MGGLSKERVMVDSKLKGMLQTGLWSRGSDRARTALSTEYNLPGFLWRFSVLVPEKHHNRRKPFLLYVSG